MRIDRVLILEKDQAVATKLVSAFAAHFDCRISVQSPKAPFLGQESDLVITDWDLPADWRGPQGLPAVVVTHCDGADPEKERSLHRRLRLLGVVSRAQSPAGIAEQVRTICENTLAPATAGSPLLSG